MIEASGVMRKKSLLQAYIEQGVKRVVVTAPVKEEGVLNVVMGVNHELYNPAEHNIVTAASCTTNCIAPVVKVIHEQKFDQMKNDQLKDLYMHHIELLL